MVEWRKCELHPDVDPDRMWGCPDCLHYLREENKRLRAVVQGEIKHHRDGMEKWDNITSVGGRYAYHKCCAGLLEQALKGRE